MTEREQQRVVNHRLSVLRHAEEITGNVAQTCRYYGISRTVYYKWLRRYEENGLEGLRDESSRPHHCPHATNAEVVGKIIDPNILWGRHRLDELHLLGAGTPNGV